MGNELDTVFEDFIEKIVLTNTQRQRIDNTVTAAQDLFAEMDVKLQGSFATGTTVKPLTEDTSRDGSAGEYDADIALVSGNWNGPVDALDDTLISLERKYGAKVDKSNKRNSCERVLFADEGTGVRFHADYVPIKYEDNQVTECVDRKNIKWKLSPTFRIINIYNEFDVQNQYASSCLLILKRLRDYAGFSRQVSSIALLTIVHEYYENQGSYVADLLHLCNRFIDLMKTNREIYFTDNNGEQLTEDLSQSLGDKDEVIKLFNAFESALRILSLENLELMTGYLSSEFPVDANDYPSQMQSLRSNNFSYDTRRGLENINIDTSDHTSRFYKKYTNAMYFTNNVGIKLQAVNHRELNEVRHLRARWRITNDPSRVPENVRGVLYPRESGNEFIKKETAQYNGIHRAELFVFENGSNRVIGKGRYKVRKVANL